MSKIVVCFIFAQMISLNLAFADAPEVGFSEGNQRTVINLKGNLWRSCRDGSNVERHDFVVCDRNIMLPYEFDYFTGPAGISADKVVLTAQHDDGTERQKDANYESAKGRTSGTVNLWIRTLFQRPLLKMGKNFVRYEMSSNGKVTAHGDFSVVVNDGGSRECRRSGMYMDANCWDDAFLCDRYFREFDYCQKN